MMLMLLLYILKKLRLVISPRVNNKELSKLLEAGYADLFTAKINRISPGEDHENQIGVVVFLKIKGKK
jgi:hypothetical protein